MPEEREEEKSFEVKDKRRAHLDDEKPAEKKEDKPREEPHAHAHEHAHEHELPPVDFISFISSLAASALMHLGDRLAPDQPDFTDLPAARNLIDILGMLDEKTKGNLSPEEAALMENILYTLRMRFVKETGGK